MQGMFPIEDITHKPKRIQGQFIEEVHKKSDNADRTDDIQQALTMFDAMPKHFITLEKAIAFYGSFSSDCYLYRFTAVCLRELLEYRKNIAVVNEKAKERELQGAEDDTEI